MCSIDHEEVFREPEEINKENNFFLTEEDAAEKGMKLTKETMRSYTS